MTARPVPLARLFAIAYRSLIEDLHAELRARGWDDVRPAFGFVLLACREAPRTSSDIAELTGTTKQAASKLIEAMEAADYVSRVVDESDTRRHPISLTTRGRRLLDAVEEIYAEAEARWSAVIGARAVEDIRARLIDVLADETGALPPVRPTW